MKISIIVPFYNAENTIEKCIDSLNEQKDVDLEIVLVNDASTDGSFELAQKYASNDRRIILVDNDKKGVSSARNKGLECCSGDIIGFCDADDYYSGDALKQVVKLFEDEKQCGVIVSAFNVCFDNGTVENKIAWKSKKLLGQKKLISMVLNNPNIMGSVWNKFFRREVLHSIRFNDDISLCEDTLFCILSLLQDEALKALYVPVITYNYCQNNNSVTHNSDMLFDGKNNLKYYRFMESLSKESAQNCFLNNQIRCARARLAYNTINGFSLDDEKINKLVQEIRNNYLYFVLYGKSVGMKNYIKTLFEMILLMR